jgi:hypothetical protein
MGRRSDWLKYGASFRVCFLILISIVRSFLRVE